MILVAGAWVEVDKNLLDEVMRNSAFLSELALEGSILPSCDLARAG
jgi:hypothetical protein